MTARLHAAVVGAGPAGFYAVDALLRRAPGARVDILERLPTPFGLVRAGVAPDHQGTKAVVRQFERTLDRPEVRFFGGVEVGRDVSLAALARRYDLVFVATGAQDDRRLDIPGSALAGVLVAGELVRWLNGHPDHRDLQPEIGREVVVLGAGNVALDVARLLAKTPEELATSDLCAHARHIPGRARRITIVARGDVDACRFSPTELQAFPSLSRAELILAPEERAGLTRLDPEAPLRRALEALPSEPRGAPCLIRLRFGLAPRAVLGEGRATGVGFQRPSGEAVVLPADTVVAAIGAVAPPDGPDPANVARVGWAAGAFGAIPASRGHAARQVEAALATLRAAGAARPLDRAELPQAVDAVGWRRIDAAEVAAADAGRPREKLTRWSELAAAAANETNMAL